MPSCCIARVVLVWFAWRLGVTLRQSDVRVGKFALMNHQRFAHAKQMKRARREERKVGTQLVIRGIERKIRLRRELETELHAELFLAGRVLAPKRGERGRKVFSLHAPEIECIGKGPTSSA